MNIALSSLLIILLLLPAIFFRTFIIKSDSLENPLDTSIKTELGIIFFLALFQHLIGYYVITNWFKNEILFDQFYFIIKGDSEYINTEILNYSFLRFFVYISLQILVNIFLALFAKWLIVRYYLDICTNFFPISNEWDKLLSGRLYEFDRVQKLNNDIKDLNSFSKTIRSDISSNANLKWKERIIKKFEVRRAIRNEISELKKLRRVPVYNYIEVDVLVNTAESDIIYKGRLYKYYLAKDNTLDKIILKDAFRRKFINEKTEINQKLEFYEFESKLFVIKYSEIKNLNVRFTFYEEVDEVKSINTKLTA
jgi:hypothetical protein